MSGAVALTVGGVGFVWLVYFLSAGRLSGASFVFGMGIVALVSLAIASPERLQELWLGKNVGLVLTQVEQIREDIYAKADTLNKIAETMAGLTAQTVAGANRFVDERNAERMLATRDEISAMLRNVGLPDDRITEIVKPITDATLSDLKHHVQSAIVAEMQARPGHLIPDNLPAMQEELSALLTEYEPVNRSAVEEWAKRAEAYNPEVRGALDRLDHFIRTGR